MEWLKNNINIWIAIALLFICFLWGLSSAVALNKVKAQIQENMTLRLSLEEKYDTLLKSKIASDKKARESQEALAQEKKTNAVTVSELNQERIVVKALKEELEKTIKLNQDLQGKLEKVSKE